MPSTVTPAKAGVHLLSPISASGAAIRSIANLDSDDPLGGPGEIVEIHETLIGGRAPKATLLANKTYVLGMLEKGGKW